MSGSRVSAPSERPPDLNLPVFQPDPACTRCDLHESCKSVGLPVRPAFPPHGTSRALLIVGEGPGATEDDQAAVFVGMSGKLLTDKWLPPCKFPGTTDVYLTNTVRCRPPNNADPSTTQIKACSHYLHRDLAKLADSYKEVVLLAVGGPACRTLTGRSLTQQFSHQGEKYLVGSVECRVFATYHPAYTIPSRNPAAAQAVADHLDLVVRTLNNDPSLVAGGYGDRYKPRLCPALPSYEIPLLSVDIETYGIEKRYNQTQFHPAKSLAYDNVDHEHLIKTVAVAWRDPQGAIQHGVFCVWKRDEWHRLVAFVLHAQALLFKNAQFDLAYLSYWGLAEPGEWFIEDLEVWNYLYSDIRPEKSLKALAPLLGLPAYVGGGFRQYDKADDPEALEYVTKDAVDTLEARDIIRGHIASAFGADSPKLSEYTRSWYSSLIWACVLASEAGVPFNRTRLIKQRAALEKEFSLLSSFSGQPLVGKGSQAVVQTLINEAAEEAGVLAHEELKKTDKTHEISTAEENLNLISAHLDADSKYLAAITQLSKLREVQKNLGTYVRPLVGPYKLKKGVPQKQSALIPSGTRHVGLVHPRWFVVPGAYSDEGKTFGTKQGRVTCTDPALQTAPAWLKDYLDTTYRPGYVLSLDLSQIELRVAAIVSGDPDMIAEYQAGVDRHWQRACEFFSPPCSVHGETRDKSCAECDIHRQVGKTCNFLIIYYGGAWRLRLTLRKDIAYETSLDWCKETVRAARNRYPGYYAWCARHIRDVSKKGYYEDPILGGGRWYTASQKVNWLDKSMLVNFPIQYIAANTLLAGQMPLTFHLAREFHSRVIHNTYDAFTIHGPLEELDDVKKLAYHYLSTSDYWRRVCDYYGREVPLLAEDKAVTFVE